MLGLGIAALYAVGSTILAVAMFTIGGAVIMLHGYLIPGTPQLTRALPESVLGAFGKNEVEAFSSNLPATKALLAVGLLDEDYRLPAEVEERIQATAAKGVNDSDVLEQAIVKKFDDVVEVSARRSLGGGENWFAFDTDEVAVRQWEARAVAALDMAVIDLLAERIPDWDDRSAADRTAMAAILRYGLQMCPACGDEYVEPEGQHMTCCGGRSLVGERQCPACDYALVDRNDLPTDAEVLA
ncbi:hypothetical protein GCM10009000_086930 [Halobacterium noricense]|uniref:Uncharacterized protein n=1 Tax=Haladaptatus pallidirubidus TaxID=1008152 RepID=A0AAV3URT2_9EURY